MSLFLRESGPVSAPTIVFLHGGGVSGWSWQSQIEAFPDYHLLVPDLPEHGRSLNKAPLLAAAPESDCGCHPRRTRFHSQGRFSQLAAGRARHLQLDRPRMDRGPRAAE